MAFLVLFLVLNVFLVFFSWSGICIVVSLVFFLWSEVAFLVFYNFTTKTIIYFYEVAPHKNKK